MGPSKAFVSPSSADVNLATLPNDAASSQDAPVDVDIELHAGWVTFLLSTPH